MERRAHIVKYQEEAGWPLVLQKLHYDSVIEIFYRGPPDIFGNVFFLKQEEIQ